MRYVYPCLLILILTTIGYGQVYAQKLNRIEGIVVDSLGVGLKGASVRLVSSLDTVSVLTNEHGFYTLSKIKSRNVSVTYSMLGYQIINKLITINLLTDHVYVPRVKLLPHTHLIPEVRILKIIPIIQKGDTTIYNMKAFNYEKNAMLEQALKNLPGFRILRDGTTYYNGQVIAGVQVDSKKFFNGDLLTATRNLPADFVKKIEVIDYYGDVSEEKGIKNTEPEKIINIILEDNRKEITFGQATIGSGTRDRYLGSLGVNKFNNGQEMSIIASVNNTNTSLFTFGSPNGTGGRNSAIGDIGDFSDQSDGLNKLSSLGISFSDSIGRFITISGGYTYQSKQNTTEGNSLLTSSYLGYKIRKSEDFLRKSHDNSHKLNFEINSKFKNQDILKIVPTLTYNNFINYNLKSTNLRNYRIQEFGNNLDTSVVNTPNAEMTVLYSKYFQKPGRKLIGEMKFNFQSMGKDESVTENFLIYDSTGLNPLVNVFNQRQLLDTRNEMSAYKASMSYVEPFLKHSLLEILYDFDITNISAVRMVRDPFRLDEGPIDSLGVNYSYQFRSNKTGLNYQYEPNDLFRVNMGLTVQPINLSGSVKGDSIQYTYNNVNLVPSVNLKYRLNKDLDMEVNYLGRNSQPNFYHIIPIRDNSKSRDIVVGNPYLKAEFNNRISLLFRKLVPNRAQYFQTNLAYTFINNKIVTSKRAVSNETIQETTFENTDGYYDVKWYYFFNTPFVNDDFQLELSGNVDYYNNISFINTLKSSTKQVLFNQNVTLKYTWNEYFESVFNTNYFLNKAVYELPYRNEIEAHSYLLSLGSKGYISERLILGAEMSQKFYRGYASELTDVSPSIINTYIEYNFLKNNMAMFRLQCYDLLDQNKNVGVFTEYIGNDIIESRNNRLGRYLMLSLNLRLQTYPNKR
ncbi:TonB-dependent receptor [Sphingobacterium sp. HJSM2_6]